jgi:hypothetical protein
MMPLVIDYTSLERDEVNAMQKAMNQRRGQKG